MNDLEAIKRLKARYFRTMDTKDWAGMRQVFTEDVVVDKLIAKGIPPADIVIGWHAPYERQYTEFAEA